MKTALFAATLSLTMMPTLVSAGGVIERACQSSGRNAASVTLCSCIQKVADQALTPSEQRKGAKFFSDPHKSQETRQSDNPADEVFWKKWKNYGALAAKHCQ